MAKTPKSLTKVKKEKSVDLSNQRIGIVTAQWNEEITNELLKGCKKTLEQLGAKKKNIISVEVPGSFELPSGAKLFVENKKVDAVICIGCIIKGETPHFDFISAAVSQGIMDLNIHYNIPFVFAVLTTNTLEQAKERCGGKHGHKGNEAAITAANMIALRKKLSK